MTTENTVNLGLVDKGNPTARLVDPNGVAELIFSIAGDDGLAYVEIRLDRFLEDSKSRIRMATRLSLAEFTQLIAFRTLRCEITGPSELVPLERKDKP